MNKIDNILDRLQNEQPILDCPNELTERIMAALPERETLISNKPVCHPFRIYWCWGAAACLLSLIGVVTLLCLQINNDVIKPITRYKEQFKTTKENIIDDSITPITRQKNDIAENNIDTPAICDENNANIYMSNVKRVNTHYVKGEKPVHEETAQISNEDNCSDDTIIVEVKEMPVIELNPQLYDNNFHYITLQSTDTTRQAPSKVNDFISKFAAYNSIKAVILNCEGDSTVTQTISYAYVFPDRDDVDLFGRLLQVAVCYDQKYPGYQLNLSNNQFVFQLHDNNKKLKYLWMAERVNGQRILLFTTQSPINVPLSTACYQEFRDELTHTGNAYQQL